jgi:uncharacterized protein YcsI (UPF0317 family)
MRLSPSAADKLAEKRALERRDLEHASPREVRAAIREGRWKSNTKRMALGHHQANVTIVPERYAFDFMRFCLRNPRPLPLLDVTDPGDPTPRKAAPDADLRTDIGAYVVLRDGEVVDRPASLEKIWRKDHVAFLTGCNLSMDRVMLEAGMPLPHLTSEDAFPAQFRSSVECEPAGAFRGPVVVSLRPVPDALVVPLIELTSRYALSHGAPVHVGDPAAIGVRDLQKVDWGKPNAIPPGHTPMFWACGITAQAAAAASRIPEMIVHAPGRLFVTDLVVRESS